MTEKEIQAIKRKGFHVYLYYLTLVALGLFFAVNLYLQKYHINFDDLDLMISVVSFLFGFLITISFSMILNKVNLLKESLALETAHLVSIFKLSKVLGNKFHERIKLTIDNYTVNTLREYSNYEVGRESLYEMYDSLETAEIKSQMQDKIFNSFIYILGEFEKTREKIEYLTKRSLLWALKAINYTLGIILIILLFLNRGVLFNDALFIVLSTTIVFILLIIEDYESLKLGDYNISIENSEQIFDLIGEKRYYPNFLLKRVHLEKGKIYRVGIYDSATKKEKVVNMKY